MSGGFWNPVTWLISGTVGYNVYTINLESLLYVFLAGTGMYKLGSLWSWCNQTKLVAAICYMCCGYFIGDLQHLNWISGAAFLPFCYYCFMGLLQERTYKKLLQSVLVFSLLLTSSHPGIIIGAIYFFVFTTIHFILKERKNNLLTNIVLNQKRLLYFLILLIICNGALILSYSEIINFITRDAKPIADTTGRNTTSIQSFISILLPFATVKGGDIFRSDIALRNCYMGLVPIVFIITALYNSVKKKQGNFFLFTALFFLFISTNSLLQAKVYQFLPLINYVRLPAEFRIFGLFCLMLFGCKQLNDFLTNNNSFKISKAIVAILSIITLILLTICIGYIVFTKNSLIFHSTEVLQQFGTINRAKAVITQLSLYDTIVLQGAIATLILLAIAKAIKKNNGKLIVLIAIIDIAVATALQLPFTGYGKLSASKIQHLINQSPKGIPTPVLHPIVQNEKGLHGVDTIIGHWSFYTKEPGTITQAFYPIIFKSESQIFAKDSINKIAQKTFIYFETTNKTADHSITLESYSPSTIHLQLNTNRTGKLTVLYKYYPHWQVFVNNERSTVAITNRRFLEIPITAPGQHKIVLIYNPFIIKTILLFQCVVWLVLITILFFKRARKTP